MYPHIDDLFLAQCKLIWKKKRKLFIFSYLFIQAEKQKTKDRIKENGAFVIIAKNNNKKKQRDLQKLQKKENMKKKEKQNNKLMIIYKQTNEFALIHFYKLPFSVCSNVCCIDTKDQ